MKWTVHGERTIYDSAWVRLALADVELPDGERFDHHVIRATGHASGTVVDNPARGVLLLWRHRFITDSWGWEIPAGRIDDGEASEDAAKRECEEETGWRPGELSPVISYFPNNGQCDVRFDIYRATTAAYIGPPSDPFESERIEWLEWPTIRQEMTEGRIRDGLSLTALLAVMAIRPD